jgi:hypothetical protein
MPKTAAPEHTAPLPDSLVQRDAPATAPATPAAPAPEQMPQRGGSYVRQPDGALQPNNPTEE